MFILLFMIGIIAGIFVPFQTSINAKLSAYTRSSFYTSAISFGSGLFLLFILNVIVHPNKFTASFWSEQTFAYYWVIGGLLGVFFITGNLFLLPRLGASMLVVMTLSGQMIMGVVIDTFGLFDATRQPFTIYHIIGIILLIIGIILMNYVKNRESRPRHITFYVWILIGFLVGCGPPIQTAINSKLGQVTGSALFASFISFFVGFIALVLLKFATDKQIRIETNHVQYGKLRPFYFIGGIFGVIFITTNIFLMPFLGAALTTIASMVGQMLMALIIDHFGLLGIRPNRVTSRKIIGIIIIGIGVMFLRLSS